MNRSFICIAVAVLFLSFGRQPEITIDNKEAQKAFTLLMAIRQHPEKFAARLKFPANTAVAKQRLVWNDTLATVATAKAYDMASRNYFGHVDPEGYGINYFINKAGYLLLPEWTASKSTNYFESLAAGTADGEVAIRTLIIDADDPAFGHRNHLLGLGNWNGSLIDVGIGFVRSKGSNYPTYLCVIIAKHNW